MLPFHVWSITFPYYVPNISPEPSNLASLPKIMSPLPQVSEKWNTPCNLGSTIVLPRISRTIISLQLVLKLPSKPFIMQQFINPYTFKFQPRTSDFFSANISRRSKPPMTYMNSFSQIRSSFYSFLLSYRERMGLISSPLCSSGRGEPHTSIHLFSCPSHPMSLASYILTVKDLWELPRLASELLFSLLIFDLPLLPPPSPKPLPSNWYQSYGHSYSQLKNQKGLEIQILKTNLSVNLGHPHPRIFWYSIHPCLWINNMALFQ